MSPAKGQPQGHLDHSLWTVVRITDLWTGLICMYTHSQVTQMPPAVGATYAEKSSSWDCADSTEIHPGSQKHSFHSVGLVPLWWPQAPQTGDQCMKLRD